MIYVVVWQIDSETWHIEAAFGDEEAAVKFIKENEAVPGDYRIHECELIGAEAA